MKTAVAVTGMGITSALGNGVLKNFEALKSNLHGIKKPEILATRHADTLPCGEINHSNQALRESLEISEETQLTRGALLGCLAAKQALDQADIDNEREEIAFINGTSIGGMDATEKFYEKPTMYQNWSEKSILEIQPPGFTTHAMARALKINGLVTTVSTACSSGANAIMMGAKLITSGRASKVLVGGTDCLTKFTLNGFNSLKILSEKPCRAFDRDRKGLNLGEGAGYLVLEPAAQTKKNSKKVLAYLTGFGNANDAHHQTASSSSGEGAYLAMRAALRKAGIQSTELDYINAHGTGTYNNDLSEGKAVKRLLADQKIPPLSSTKAFTGHTLGASGAIEAVFSILALQHQAVFPNLNFKTPIPELGFSPVTDFYTTNIHHVLSNSFGFGGNCTALIFSS